MFGNLSALSRSLASILLAASLAPSGASGCADHTIHADKLQSEFQSASPEAKSQVDAAVADINAGKFAEALPVLQKVAFGAKMSKEQRDVLEDTVRKVREKVQSSK